MNTLSFKTSLGWIILSEENNQIMSIEFGKKKNKGKHCFNKTEKTNN